MDERTKETIIQNHIAGIEPKVIAQQLGYSRRHVDRVISKEFKGEKPLFGKAAEIFQWLQAKQNARVRKYYECLSKDNPASVRIKALDSLREEDKEFIKRCQLAGLLPKDKAEIEVDNSSEQYIVNFNIIQPKDEQRIVEHDKNNKHLVAADNQTIDSPKNTE